jgi:hypothetical protein
MKKISESRPVTFKFSSLGVLGDVIKEHKFTINTTLGIKNVKKSDRFLFSFLGLTYILHHNGAISPADSFTEDVNKI